MTGRLQGKRVIITGAASGIGAETARRMFDEGARVVVADIAAKLGGRPCGNSVMWGREVAAEEIERAATRA